jgi:exodeoxyribonuclease V alpha subunit
MKANRDIKSVFPQQILAFFARANPDIELSESLPLLEKLYKRLEQGFSSLESAKHETGLDTLLKCRLAGKPDDNLPLVLTDNGDFYFRKYYIYENAVAKKITAWTKEHNLEIQADISFLEKLLHDSEDQIEAAKISLQNQFSIITGGPGTGKTFLLVAILQSVLQKKPNLKITLAAPTGKAAQRMTESILINLEKIHLSDEEKSRFPKTASTIHRILQPLPPSIHFRRNTSKPLDTDFLIIDEASMIDLPLMSKLFDAVPENCRVLLLGDADQLAPVEAGAPFASIVTHFMDTGKPGLVAKLTRNRRFGVGSSIHKLCKFISSGDIEKVEELCNNVDTNDLIFKTTWDENEINQLIFDGYESLVNAKDPKEAHQAFLKFQILCPTHHGEQGVIAINERCRKLFSSKLESQATYFCGMPIIIKQNDYGCGLFNGDIGIFLPSEENPDKLSVWFISADGSAKCFSPSRIPAFELAYAITVHRSQGSEYNDVLLILPKTESEILSRHLLYVAVSRAKNLVRIYGSNEILLHAVGKKLEFSQSLEHRLLDLK